jgi:DNA-binding PadR family transcriptional regulator
MAEDHDTNGHDVLQRLRENGVDVNEEVLANVLRSLKKDRYIVLGVMLVTGPGGFRKIELTVAGKRAVANSSVSARVHDGEAEACGAQGSLLWLCSYL